MNDMPNNPYAAPKALSSPMVSSECYRDGNILVVPLNHDLPHRCIKCNAPAEMDKPRMFTWHPAGWYLFFLINFLIYIVVAALVQKKARLSIGLCEQHRARRRNYKIAACVAVGVGSAALFAAMDKDGNGKLYGLLSALSFLIALVLAMVGTRALTPVRITPQEARLKGCGEEFLASLHSR
ncbi:hypothetical protein [Massilia genomosp. 1]|uniref:Uncharacterized protein n=1 Tax=Massilia genomosp. 1 TaxID=2609280 RepID=A0ABX0MZG4_9BURK|nr:hypothetical protein [Massilia genomosp. 1]NHZ65631.1 hypothetical protein [Massilia genomosp. 1]